MTKTEVICDGCGIRKGETNHWWRVWMSNVGFHMYGAGYNSQESPFPEVRDFPQTDYCSESCVAKALSQFMGARKVEEVG
jgi:hypothetical protein